MEQIKRINNLSDVVKRLLGLINPQGRSEVDVVRYDNLNQTIQITEELINDIMIVSKNKDSQEYSVSKAGIKAEKFLKDLQQTLNEKFI